MNAWIERRNFPGACPPALSEITDIFEPNELAIIDLENLRLHYSRTLQMWAQRFEQHHEDIVEMMDEEFYRAWRLYLYGSIAAFNVGELQLFQVVFTHVTNNAVPWTRKHIYDRETDVGCYQQSKAEHQVLSRAGASEEIPA
jgi:cyclopropane-fatty-acyl-phospholipid synthase